MPTLIADRRLCLTADRSEVVEESDPRASWLLVGAGKTIGSGDVERYGLTEAEGRITWGAAPATKAAPKPEDKQAAKPEDKGASVDEVGRPDEDDLPDWPLEMDPETYLERYPDGPNADLARQILDAQDSSGES
jgi:hypothetical protein